MFKKNLKAVIIVLFWLVASAYVSFLYFRTTDFPVGHDVINHIQRSLAMQHENLAQAFKENLYPIPAFLLVWFYDFFHKFFGWDWPKVFLFTECFFLFLTSVLSGVFAWNIFKKWQVAIITSLLVGSSRWLLGSLITGLMGEAFGWAVFVLCLILLTQKKWVWFAITFILLLFSHPIPFGVMCVFLIAYLVYYSIYNKKYWILISGIVGLATILIVGYFALPEKRDLILYFLKIKFPAEGEWRYEYVVSADHRRFVQYLLGLLGFFVIFFNKNSLPKERRCWLILFSTLSFFVTFKYLFGIHYLSFRYYTYFEIFNSILAAYMIWFAADNMFSGQKIKAKIKQIFTAITLVVLAFLAVWPNVHGGYLFTKSQLEENTATTTPVPERTFIEDAAKQMPKGGIVIGQRRWVWWFQSFGFTGINLEGKSGYSDLDATYLANPNELLSIFYNYGANYIYFSSVDPKYEFEHADFLKKIFDKDNIRVYEVK